MFRDELFPCEAYRHKGDRFEIEADAAPDELGGWAIVSLSAMAARDGVEALLAQRFDALRAVRVLGPETPARGVHSPRGRGAGGHLGDLAGEWLLARGQAVEVAEATAGVTGDPAAQRLDVERAASVLSK